MINQQYIAGLRPEYQELDLFIRDYTSRQALGTTFLPTEVFIRQEIEDVTRNIMNQKLFGVGVEVGASLRIMPFKHAMCATIVFEALTRGRNPTVGQVIEQAKAEAEMVNRKTEPWGISVKIEEEFQTICYNWIKIGIAFAYYIRYLYKKMQDHSLTLANFIVVNNTGDGNVFTLGSNNNIDVKLSVDKTVNPQEDINQPPQGI